MSTYTTKAHDSINRRYRSRPVSTGKIIRPTDRDLLLFQKLHWHGPLSSTYLRAYSRTVRKNDKRTTERLCDLFNEDNTRHGERYLDRPHQQFATLDARQNDLVYDLLPAGMAALQEESLFNAFAPKIGRAWKHAFATAAVTSSIELATLETDTVNYIPGHVILERANTGFSFPTTVNDKTINLIPDGLFGLEYIDNGKKYYRFFVVEVDRATEPVSGSTFDRKSHERNVIQYHQFIAHGLYKQALGLTAGLLVLYVTVSDGRMRNLIDITDNNYSLFTYVQQFGHIFKPPPILYNLFNKGWQRAGREPFHINTIDGIPTHDIA